MRFFIILSLALSCVHGSVVGVGAAAAAAAAPAAAASGSADVCRRDFPNYFAKLKPDEAKQLINQSLRSILEHLEVPYVEEGKIRYDGFFKKIQQIVDTKAPGGKAYISGGMVRSLLGYIYKKMHGMMMDATYFTPEANPQKAIEEVLYDIIYGKRRTDALLSEFAVNEEDAIPYKKRDKEGKIIEMLGGSAIYEQGEKFKPKELIPLQALGIASDYDILIDFPLETADDIKEKTKNAVTDFINSLETYLNLRDDTSSLKKAILPVADVKEYSMQIDRATKQGGATLDWLAFPVMGGVMKLPKDHADIMDGFVHGHLHYIANQEATDKQTMRGLRALLEIPFLMLDPKSSQVMAEELRVLIAKGALSSDALEQLEKMTRNARFAGAHNLFSGGNCMPDGEVTLLVQELAAKLGKQTLLPEFAGSHFIRNRPVVQNAPTFMPYEEFISKYTDTTTFPGKNILYHGTPDIMNFLSMIRNGPVVSSATQGTAFFGYGFYTTGYRAEAEKYTSETGIVIPLTVNESAQIVDMAIPEHMEHYTNWFKTKRIKERTFGDPFKEYADEFGIDIIVNTHVLVQNAKAIRLEKSLKSIVDADRALLLAKVRGGKVGVTINNVLQKLDPDSPYGKMFPPTDEDLKIFQDIDRRVREIPFLKELLDAGVMDTVYLSNLELISADLSEENVNALISLFKEGVIEMLDIYTLIEVLDDVSKEKAMALIKLFKKGAIGKLPKYDIKNIPVNLSVEKAEFFIELVREGICKTPLLLRRIPIPDNLLPIRFQIPELKQLIEAGVMEKLSGPELLYIPADLSPITSQIRFLQQLIEAGVMEKLSPFSLGNVPADLSPAIRQIEELKQKVKERDRKLSIIELTTIK